jgi:phosphotriesterase-related protein
MAQVQTARGPVEAARLGRVLMHEHVFVLTTEVQQNYPEEWGDVADNMWEFGTIALTAASRRR